jgi:Predicted signal transduction protein with a C-terminal ATPase domain
MVMIMQHIKYWIRRLSIRKKLIFYSYIIITPILLIISAILFVRNYNATIEKENESYLQSTQNLTTSIDVLQKNIIEFGTYICINNDIKLILTSDEPKKLNEDSLLWLHNAPMRIFQDMMALSGQIKTVAIYPENGVNPYLRCMDATSYLKSTDLVHTKDIYHQVVMRKGKIIWRKVSKNDTDTYEANRTDKIVMYREIFDLAKKHKLGYLVIGASMDKFTELCNNSLASLNEAIVVVSADGSELIRSGKVDEDILSQVIKDEAEGVIVHNLSGYVSYINYKIYYSRDEDTGTIVYRFVEKEGLGKQLFAIAFAPAILLLGFLVGLFPILIFVSNIISKPLNKLCNAMELFKKGDFKQKVEVNTLDEVGEAAACFNQMVDDIKTLIDNNYIMALREKESELNALQAQINPHFLYNTLDSLYWQATDADHYEIAENIYALSQLFRLVLGQGKGIVTVRNEKDLIDRYLHIQKMRFEKRLDYEIKIEEEILDANIPKLILQPFVENAIVHGFEKAGEKCLISLHGKKKGDRIIFMVKDNGIGMNKEQVKAILEVNDSERYASQRIGRYAIKNIRERLELKYHEDFKLLIYSKEGSGTTVIIELPFENKEM